MGVSQYLSRLSTIEEFLFVALLLRLFPSEVGIIELAYINTRDIDLGRGSDDISGIDSADRDTVDFEGASNKENTLGEGLQQNNTLSTKSTSEDNEDGTRLEGWAEAGLPGGLAGLVVEEGAHTSESAFQNNLIQPL